MSIENAQNFIPQSYEQKKKENMFTSFEVCEKELELMKKEGTYIELKTVEGDLAAENGLPSKYKDYPLLYGILQTPTFKKVIGDGSENFAIYEDTKEPMIVYHSTPIEIPLNDGLKPHKKRLGPARVLGEKDSIVMSIRRKFKLFPIRNLQLYFAQDANSTKTKAAASTREKNDPHKIYPCFIKISKPYTVNDGYEKSKYSWDGSDGTIQINKNDGDVDFSVKSEKQVMHVPFNFVGIYTPEKEA